MRINQLLETSDNNFEGSITTDLILSKLWICEQLKELDKTRFTTIYILGSWYGNLGFVLTRSDIKFKKIINVDIDKNRIDITDQIYKQLKIPSENMWADANTVDFRQADAKSAIINTSVQDIDPDRWFDNMPKGPLVVLQSRNNSEQGYPDLKTFDERFPLTNTMYLNQREFNDPETDYLRFMKIGIK